jgi:hypothetical protein
VSDTRWKACKECGSSSGAIGSQEPSFGALILIRICQLEEQITINRQHFQKKYTRKPNTGYKQKQLLNIHIYVSVCEHANFAKLKVKTIIRITVAQVAIARSRLVIKIKPCK